MPDGGTFQGEQVERAVRVHAAIRELAKTCTDRLASKVLGRIEEMRDDDRSHHLLYRLLGVDADEGDRIDIYQNKGRFLYNNAGLFLEKAVRLCFEAAYDDCPSCRIPNTIGLKPKTFQIDCLIDKRDAIEIKWRDATTDGDHVIKEHNRIQAISDAGYRPIRIMFYMPNRESAVRIQNTLSTLYAGIGGEYHIAGDAWAFVEERTGIDLLGILIAVDRERSASQ